MHKIFTCSSTIFLQHTVKWGMADLSYSIRLFWVNAAETLLAQSKQHPSPASGKKQSSRKMLHLILYTIPMWSLSVSRFRCTRGHPKIATKKKKDLKKLQHIPFANNFSDAQIFELSPIVKVNLLLRCSTLRHGEVKQSYMLLIVTPLPAATCKVYRSKVWILASTMKETPNNAKYKTT